MELSPSQLQSLDAGQAVPLVVGGRSCVLLSDAAFDAVRQATDAWRPEALQRQLAQLMQDDWSDPAMSVYDE
jgi:hypothetical protein